MDWTITITAIAGTIVTLVEAYRAYVTWSNNEDHKKREQDHDIDSQRHDEDRKRQTWVIDQNKKIVESLNDQNQTNINRLQRQMKKIADECEKLRADHMECRVEAEVAKSQLAENKAELHKIRDELDAAETRIGELESQIGGRQ